MNLHIETIKLYLDRHGLDKMSLKRERDCFRERVHAIYSGKEKPTREHVLSLRDAHLPRFKDSLLDDGPNNFEHLFYGAVLDTVFGIECAKTHKSCYRYILLAYEQIQ